MPPKAKITKQMILNTVLEMTRETGFHAVNARSIAGRLQCSTRPIFTCYETMEELKKEFLAFAYEFYERYVDQFRQQVKVSDALILPLSYMDFAQQEANLFWLLFLDDMDLFMTQPKDFYSEAENENKAILFSKTIGVKPERAKAMFLDLFLYTHGMAVLTATKKLTLDRTQTQTMLEHVLTAFIKQENPNWSA